MNKSNTQSVNDSSFSNYQKEAMSFQSLFSMAKESSLFSQACETAQGLIEAGMPLYIYWNNSHTDLEICVSPKRA